MIRLYSFYKLEKICKLCQVAIPLFFSHVKIRAQWQWREHVIFIVRFPLLSNSEQMLNQLVNHNRGGQKVGCLHSSLHKIFLDEDEGILPLLNEFVATTCQNWKIAQFSKSFKIVKKAPNHVLNSGKNRYRVFWTESKTWKKFIMPMFGRKKFSRHVCVFLRFWKSEKIRFCL